MDILFFSHPLYFNLLERLPTWRCVFWLFSLFFNLIPEFSIRSGLFLSVPNGFVGVKWESMGKWSQECMGY